MQTDWVRKGECNHCGFCCLFLATAPHVLGLEKEGLRDKHGEFDEQHLAVRQIIDQPDAPGKANTYAWFYSPCSEFNIDELRCRIQDTKPRTCHDFPWSTEQVLGTPCSYYFEKTTPERDVTHRIGGEGSPYPGYSSQRGKTLLKMTDAYFNVPYPLIMPRSLKKDNELQKLQTDSL